MLAYANSRALDYLMSQRTRDGWWRDFNTLAGASDEWVTAYVGNVLADGEDERARKAARQAWEVLRRRRWWSAGWGYNGRVPADADSTLWALHLAHRVGAKSSLRINRARRFVSRHLRANGGVATYAEDRAIRLFTRLQRHITFDGWCGSHLCVTAVAACLPRFEGHARALEYLRQAQRPDGSWVGYWWCDRAYTTSLAVKALTQNGSPSDLARIERAVSWAAGRVTRQGSVMSSYNGIESACAAAWCVQILTRSPAKHRARTTLEDIVSRLLLTQRTDGAWPPSALLRIPPPGVTDPETYAGWIFDGGGGGSVQADANGYFTTASVLAALQEAARPLS